MLWYPPPGPPENYSPPGCQPGGAAWVDLRVPTCAPVSSYGVPLAGGAGAKKSSASAAAKTKGKSKGQGQGTNKNKNKNKKKNKNKGKGKG